MCQILRFHTNKRVEPWMKESLSLRSLPASGLQRVVDFLQKALGVVKPPPNRFQFNPQPRSSFLGFDSTTA